MYDSRQFDGGRDAYGRDSFGRDRDMFGRDERKRNRYDEDRERDYSPERSFHQERERDYQSSAPIKSAAGFGAKSEEHLLDIREYAAQHRDRQRSRKGANQDQQIDDEEMANRYEVYKKSFVSSMNEKYFKIHSSEEWFREKYHPKENDNFLKQVHARKADSLNEFEADLLNGKFASVDLNETDGNVPFTEGISHGIHLKSNATSKSNVLFITGVPLDIKRADLLQLCHQIPGFKYLELSEPRPDKNMVRIGWVVCHEGTDMNVALQAIHEKKIDSHVLNVLESSKGISTSLRSITGHANKPSRLVHDLAQAKRLAEHLDQEAEFEPGHGLSLVLKHMEPILEQIPQPVKDENDGNIDVEMSEQNEKNDTTSIDVTDQGINAARVSKELDIIIVYLHKVHFFDYYNQLESTSPEDHTRKGGISTRKSYEKVKDPQSPPYWLQKLIVEERINPTPPQDPQMRIDKEMTKYIVKEADTKYRCSECQKLFRGNEFVRKHLRSKHPVLVENLDNEVKFFHTFCAKAHIDLHKASSHRDTTHHHRDENIRGAGYQGNKRSYPDRDRDLTRSRPRGGFHSQPPRGGKRSYTDLDAQKHQTIVLNYD